MGLVASCAGNVCLAVSMQSPGSGLLLMAVSANGLGLRRRGLPQSVHVGRIGGCAHVFCIALVTGITLRGCGSFDIALRLPLPGEMMNVLLELCSGSLMATCAGCGCRSRGGISRGRGSHRTAPDHAQTEVRRRIYPHIAYSVAHGWQATLGQLLRAA